MICEHEKRFVLSNLVFITLITREDSVDQAFHRRLLEWLSAEEWTQSGEQPGERSATCGSRTFCVEFAHSSSASVL